MIKKQIHVKKTPFLSFKDGRPISRIEGGEYNKNIVYLRDPEMKNKDEEEDDGEIPFDELAHLFENFFKHLKGRIPYLQLNKVIHHLKNDTEPEDENLKDLFYQAKDVISGSKGKELILNDGDMIPIPNPDTRECLYICGQSGSGKSTYASNYIKEFKKLYPKKKIYLFSRVDQDEVLDKLKPIRIEITQDLVDDPIKAEELKDSICVFDDIDTIPDKDKKIKTALFNLVDDLLEIGRHHGIYVLRISHLINNHKETRKILNECTSLTIFPGGSSAYAIKYALEKYFGFDKKQTEKIMKLPSRWITIYKNYPTTILYSKGAYILN